MALAIWGLQRLIPLNEASILLRAQCYASKIVSKGRYFIEDIANQEQCTC